MLGYMYMNLTHDICCVRENLYRKIFLEIRHKHFHISDSVLALQNSSGFIDSSTGDSVI